MISSPRDFAATPIGSAITIAERIPEHIVTIGVTIISSFVSLLTALPSSDAIIVIIRTAKAPPAPPSSFAATPTEVREKRTSGGHLSA